MERKLTLLPGLIVTLYFALFIFYGHFLDLGEIASQSPQELVKLEAVGEGLKAKYFWGVSALMVTAALFWNLSISLLIIYQNHALFPKSYKIFPITVLLLSGIPITMLMFGWSISGEIANKLHQIINTHSKINISSVLDALNILAFLVILSIAAALGVLITKKRGEKVSLNDISSKFEWAKISLYSAAMLLTVGVIEVYAQYSWAAVYLEGDIKVAFYQTAGVLALSAGAVFSALLLILYIPVALLHKSWLLESLKTAQEGKEEFDVDQWLKRNGLDKSSLKAFGKFSSIVFPAIVGAVIKVIVSQ